MSWPFYYWGITDSVAMIGVSWKDQQQIPGQCRCKALHDSFTIWKCDTETLHDNVTVEFPGSVAMELQCCYKAVHDNIGEQLSDGV